MKPIHTSSSRKRAIARVTLHKGTGLVRINNQELSTIPNVLWKEKILEPLRLAGDAAKKIDVSIKTEGGGAIGQAEAARTALALAITQFDKSLSKPFAEYDRTLLVRDVRRKETHKPNRHGKARAKVQKSYR
ncbi:30S ribosomal protein S9 [Candidatus Woesearchaeota archaeon]|nr:30S ribosomal protein S9 [Candidatus Woesearchaeota archaeon]